MLAIYKKELRSYFINPIGYVYMGIFLLFSSLACCYTTIISSSYDTSAYFLLLVISLVILIPLLTMRLFAEERKLRTEQLLLTAPVTITSMVLGKFFAALTLFASTVLVSCVNFLPLYVIGHVEREGLEYSAQPIGPVSAQIFGSILGILLLGAAFIAIGTFISALTENQLSAAIITIGVLFCIVVVSAINSLINSDGQQIVASFSIRSVLDWISVLSRYDNFAFGIFDFSALLYYLSLAGVFLFLTVRVYEKRRWG